MTDAPRPIEVTKSTIKRLGLPDLPVTIAAYGDGQPRASIGFRETTIVDQWDLDEIASPTAGRNWRAISLMVMTVTDIDNVPVQPFGTLSKQAIRQRLERIGQNGLEAMMEAQRLPDAEAGPDPIEPEAAHRAQVGNSPETAPSAS